MEIAKTTSCHLDSVHSHL